MISTKYLSLLDDPAAVLVDELELGSRATIWLHSENDLPMHFEHFKPCTCCDPPHDPLRGQT